MKSHTQKRHVIDFIFPVALLFVFAVSALIVVLLSARIYESTTEDSQEHYTSRTALSYISEKLRQNDENGAVSLGTLNDSDCLIMTQGLGDTAYTTYIYEYEGVLRELSVKKGVSPSPNAGEMILEVEEFHAETIADTLFRFTITTKRENSHSITVGIRSQKARRGINDENI